jgi:hypothetical protein
MSSSFIDRGGLSSDGKKQGSAHSREEFAEFVGGERLDISSLEQFLAIVDDRHPRALDLLHKGYEYLSNRDLVLAGANPILLREAVETSEYYNRLLQRHIQSSSGSVAGNTSLEPHGTVSRYSELIPFVSNQVKALWDVGRQGAGVEGEFERAFEWNFDRLKKLEQGSAGPRVGIARRFGDIDGLSIPYPIHTHVDVPFAMSQAGLLKTSLALYVAFAHDSIEEGRNLIYNLDEQASLVEVSAENFKDFFPDGQLGDRVAIGVRALTESSFARMSAVIGHEKISELYELSVESRRSALGRFPDRDWRIDKIYIEDPMVFGGLATQIPVVARCLMEKDSFSVLTRFSLEERQELIVSIIATEIGDRLSDMASLEGDIDWFFDEANIRTEKSSPEESESAIKEALDFATFKISAYTCRLLNMHEKLSEAVRVLPEEVQGQFAEGLELYLGTLYAKITEIDTTLKGYGHQGLSIASLQHFFEEEFRPFQQKAEEVFGGFVQQKVESIISGTDDHQLF